MHSREKRYINDGITTKTAPGTATLREHSGSRRWGLPASCAVRTRARGDRVTFAKRLAALVAAATLAMLGGPTPADAATYSPMDGHYAYEFGCRADQQVIFHKVLYNGSTALGYVDLMYSVNCHTAWAHAHSVSATSETWALYAFIHRNRDDREEVDQVK